MSESDHNRQQVRRSEPEKRPPSDCCPGTATSNRMFIVDSDGQLTPLDRQFASRWKVPRAGRALPLHQRFSRAWEISQSMLERLADENGLRNALDQEELVVHYQPQFSLQTLQIVGAEALVRWEHPVHGLVPPGDFIPLAEETGMIVQLGEWVMRTACAQNKAWQGSGLPAIPVAVNVSPRQFRESDLLSLIEDSLSNSGLAPEWLDVEITEGAAMANVDHSIAVSREICEIGARVSIDDFGTGYSSLAYLKQFSLHSLKIDRSFVKGIASNGDDAAIARAILAMAQALGLEVVAEGVETEDQLGFLSENGCHTVQGFYLGKPMPADSLTALFEEQLAAEAGKDKVHDVTIT